MIHAFEPAAITTVNMFEATTSSAKNGKRKTIWHRLTYRFSEIRQTKPGKSGKLGTLMRLAEDERKLIALSKQLSQDNQERFRALENEIQSLHERIKALEEAYEASKQNSACVGQKLQQIECRVQMLLDQRLSVPPADGAMCIERQGTWKRVLNRCVEQIRTRDYNLNHVEESSAKCCTSIAVQMQCARCGTFEFHQ